MLTQIPAQFPSSVKLGKDNFLVALSALASNSEIVGYSSIPTDTVLVLDMSSSMNRANAIDDLAVAANNAVKALYAADGDSIYAVSVGDVPADQDLVGALAAEVVSEAILRAVDSVEGAYGLPAVRDLR